MIEINLIDMATPLMRQIIENCPKAARTATKSVGFKMRAHIQEGMKNEAPGGQKYARLFSPAVRYQMDRLLGRRGKTRYPILGRLRNAVAYGYQNSNSRGYSVVIGWLSASAAQRGSQLQEGFKRPLTSGMRKLMNEAFEKAGMDARLSKSKHTLDTPARPTITPAKTSAAPLIPKWFEESFYHQLKTGKLTSTTTTPRKSRKIYT